MSVIANLRVMLSADSAQLKTAFKKTDKESRAWAKKQKARNAAVAKSFKRVAGGVTVAATALTAATAAAIEYADNLAKTSSKLGLTVEQLDKYRFAAEAAGMETRMFDMGIQRFTRRLGEAAQNQGVLKDTFKELGIAIRDNNGKLRSTEAVLEDYADALERTEDPQERLRLAFKAFDAEGVAMVNLMSNGSKGMRELTKRAVDLGAVMSNETAKKAEFLSDKIGAFTKVLKTKFYTALVEGVDKYLPMIVRALGVVEGAFNIITGAIQGNIANFHLLRAAVSRIALAFVRVGRVLTEDFLNGLQMMPLYFKKMVLEVKKGYHTVVNAAKKAGDSALSSAPDFVKRFFGYEDGSFSSGSSEVVANLTAQLEEVNTAIQTKAAELAQQNGPSLLEKTLTGSTEDALQKAYDAATRGAENIKNGIAQVLGEQNTVAGDVDGAVGNAGEGGGQGGGKGGKPADPLANKLNHFKNFMEKMRTQQKKLTDSFGGTWKDIAVSFGQSLDVMGKAGKAFAIGQIVYNTSQAVMAALSDKSVPNFYMRLANAGIATMMGAQSLATVKGQFHDGIDSVPSTGTYLLEKGERVVDSRLNGDLKESLKSGGMSGGGEQNITFSVQGVEDPDVINRVIQENRGEFESMLRQINADRAGAGLI